MNILLLVLLAVDTYASTPITDQSWVKFTEVPTPTYDEIPRKEDFIIINATTIPVEEKSTQMEKMLQKSVEQFQEHLETYATEMHKKIKRATSTHSDYRFVRKPEL